MCWARCGSGSRSYQLQNAERPPTSARALADGPPPVEVREEQRHLGERRSGDLGKRKASGAHDVVGARAPPRLVDPLEHARDVIDDQVRIGAGEDVQTHGVLAVVRVDHAGPALTSLGKPFEDRLD
jgi:hypothetical protein